MDKELHELHCEMAMQYMLAAANELVRAIDTYPHDQSEVVAWWQTMDALRTWADIVSPPQTGWPQGGAEIIDLECERRKRG